MPIEIIEKIIEFSDFSTCQNLANSCSVLNQLVNDEVKNIYVYQDF